jgi:hypothetical protein
MSTVAIATIVGDEHIHTDDDLEILSKTLGVKIPHVHGKMLSRINAFIIIIIVTMIVFSPMANNFGSRISNKYVLLLIQAIILAIIVVIVAALFKV